MDEQPAPPWKPRPGAPAGPAAPGSSADPGWAALPGDGEADATGGAESPPPRGAIAAGVAIVALLLVGLVLGVVELTRPDAETAATSAGGAGAPPPTVAGVEETRRLLAGIPQDGALLGRDDAPVTLYSFVDLQCPFCRDHALQAEPPVVQRLVRSGRVAIRTVPLTGLGRDSERGAIVAWRAAASGRMAQFVHLWFLNQGYEGTGYATEGYLRALTDAAGLAPPDAQPLPTRDISRRIALDAGISREVGITGTPGFALARRGGTPRQWVPTGAAPFVVELEAEVRRLGG